MASSKQDDDPPHLSGAWALSPISTVAFVLKYRLQATHGCYSSFELNTCFAALVSARSRNAS